MLFDLLQNSSDVLTALDFSYQRPMPRAGARANRAKLFGLRLVALNRGSNLHSILPACRGRRGHFPRPVTHPRHVKTAPPLTVSRWAQPFGFQCSTDRTVGRKLRDESFAQPRGLRPLPVRNAEVDLLVSKPWHRQAAQILIPATGCTPRRQRGSPGP